MAPFDRHGDGTNAVLVFVFDEYQFASFLASVINVALWYISTALYVN